MRVSLVVTVLMAVLLALFVMGAGDKAFAGPLGTQENFWVRTSEATLAQKPFTLTAVGEHSLVYSEEGIEPTMAEMVAREFDTRIYPVVRRLIGEEPSPGVDGDTRISLLLASLQGNMRGYFDALNQYRGDMSNEREMIVVDADADAESLCGVFSTIAHEFQHLIHYSIDANEELWVTEGLSQLSEYILYGVRIHLDAFWQHPSVSLVEWSQTREGYGATLSFTEYIFRKYADDFSLRELVSEPRDGIRGMDTYLREAAGVSFETAFSEWTIANAMKVVPDEPIRGESGSQELTLFIQPWSAEYLDVQMDRLPESVRVVSSAAEVEATAIWTDASGSLRSEEIPIEEFTDGVVALRSRWRVPPKLLVFRAKERQPTSETHVSGPDYGKYSVMALVMVGCTATIAKGVR